MTVHTIPNGSTLAMWCEDCGEFVEPRVATSRDMEAAGCTLLFHDRLTGIELWADRSERTVASGVPCCPYCDAVLDPKFDLQDTWIEAGCPTREAL